MNLLDLVAPATMAGHRAKKEAAKFAAGVKPGKTYYSVVDCNWPWGKGRLLMEWTFTGGRFLGPRCGHLTPAGAWLSYGPIHAERPAGLQTMKEYRRRPELMKEYRRRPDFPPDAARAIRDAQLTPAGV